MDDCLDETSGLDKSFCSCSRIIAMSIVYATHRNDDFPGSADDGSPSAEGATTAHLRASAR